MNLGTAGKRGRVLVLGDYRQTVTVIRSLGRAGFEVTLGADMVFIGRAAMYGVAAGGEAGVRRALQLLRSEIDRVLALLGCSSIEELGPQYLRLQPRELASVRPLQVPRLRTA